MTELAISSPPLSPPAPLLFPAPSSRPEDGVGEDDEDEDEGAEYAEDDEEDITELFSV